MRKLTILLAAFFDSDFGTTIKNSWIYLSGSIALTSLSILSIPIMTRLLTEEDYGILNIFTAFAGIASIAFTLNTNVGVVRRYFESNSEFESYLGTSFLISYSLIMLSTIFLLFNSEWFASLLGLPEITLFFIGPFAIKAVSESFHLQVFRARSEPRKVRSLNLISGYISFIVGVTLVYFHQGDGRYMGLLWSGLIMTILTGGMIFYRLRPFVQFNVKFEHVKYMMFFGIPLLPSYLASIILGQFDRVMIGSYLGNAEAGLYSFAYNISMIQLMVVNALYYSWEPKYYQYMKDKNYKKHDLDTLKLLSISCFSACGLILFADMIGYILGAKSFHKSLYLIPMIVFGQFILSINPIYKRHITFVKKTIYTSMVVIIAGVLNIWLNSIYIPIYGAAAGALTTVVSYLVMFVLTFWVVKYVIRQHTTPLYKIGLKVSVVSLSCAFYYVNLYLLDVHLVIQILLNLVVLAVCGILLFSSFIPKRFSIRFSK